MTTNPKAGNERALSFIAELAISGGEAEGLLRQIAALASTAQPSTEAQGDGPVAIVHRHGDKIDGYSGLVRLLRPVAFGAKLYAEPPRVFRALPILPNPATWEQAPLGYASNGWPRGLYTAEQMRAYAFVAIERTAP